MCSTRLCYAQHRESLPSAALASVNVDDHYLTSAHTRGPRLCQIIIIAFTSKRISLDFHIKAGSLLHFTMQQNYAVMLLVRRSTLLRCVFVIPSRFLFLRILFCALTKAAVMLVVAHAASLPG